MSSSETAEVLQGLSLGPQKFSAENFLRMFLVLHTYWYANIHYMKTHISHSLPETEKIAGEWLTGIAKSHTESDEALVVGLSGHLGAGKTAFVKAVAKILGVKETVTSPTFVLMKIYEINTEVGPLWKRLIHIDAYRLEKREELEALDFERLVSDPHNLILIEWPENVGLTDFKDGAFLSFEIIDGNHHISIR